MMHDCCPIVSPSEVAQRYGLNQTHYPQHVRKIVTMDPKAGMNQRLQRRIDQTGIEVDKQIISSDSLPFDGASFEYLVSTITSCSIPNVKQAMAKLFRVLKPDSRALFLEHGGIPDVNVAKWQRRLNDLQ